jgi:SOS-response transcriptional repressor LexA
MSTDHRARLAKIKRFDQLIAYLRDEMGWPIDRIEIDDLMFDYAPEELGIDPKNAAKIEEIKRLRPLSARQPWGIFFLRFAPKKLPVVALRRVLSQVAFKKRATAEAADRAAWAADDLLFISNYGEGEERRISFAHFSQAEGTEDLPTLKVLGWDDLDTGLHLDAVASKLTMRLAWPVDEKDADAWRRNWRAAFTLPYREVIRTSKELSIRLAALARAIHNRAKSALAIETDRGRFTKLMNAFREALVHDLDADGFADMYAQTIAYGLLSARIADPHAKTADDFAVHMRTNPFLRELLEAFLRVGGRRGKAGGSGIDFDELGVSEVVELLDDANMEAVVGDFGDKNPQEDPVIHFYEDFLAYYNPGKKKLRGVFYTPRPVVSYIVRSVDELLRTELGLQEGLADTTTWREMAKRHKELKIPDGVSPDQDFVQILDPACGTGTFLVEVIDLIQRTLVAKWKAQGHGEKKIDALWNEYVPEHLLPRLHGYELLMAPYAIAHLKIGLRLHETGYRFASDERARIFLTNALEPPSDVQFRITSLLALAHEAQAVNEIKRNHRFTVVVGNPPYSTSISEPMWLMTLLEDWKRGLRETKSDLNREEWKFLRLGQHLCATSGHGVLGVIINRDFLDGVTKRRMREHLGLTFPLRTVIDLNGDVKGNIPDENVFEIEQGVTIAVLCTDHVAPQLRFSSRVGTRDSKYRDLAAKTAVDSDLVTVEPAAPYFKWIAVAGGPHAAEAAAEYAHWFPVDAMFGVYSSGIQTKNDPVCIAWTAEEIWARVNLLAATSAGQATRELGITEGGVWSIAAAKKDLKSTGLSKGRIRRILYRPFDWRFTYLTEKSGGFLGRPRFDVMKHMLGGSNVGFVFNRQVVGESVTQFGVSRDLICHGTFYLGNKGQDYIAPLYLSGATRLGSDERQAHNLTASFLDRVRHALATSAPEPEALLGYIYAVVHSPGFRSRYFDHLRADFPRVPLPGGIDVFRELVAHGARLVALHLMESFDLDRFITTYTGPKNPEVQRVGWSDNAVWLDAAATKKGQPARPGTIGFRGVPEAVWNFRVGGYQVCEKWLKDRRGRTLSKDDIVHYQKIVVALNETIRLMKEIDEVIEKHGGWPGAFQTGATGTSAPSLTPFQPRVVKPRPEERYVSCVPLVPLKAAAGVFGDSQRVDEGEFEWVEVQSSHRLRRGMFVAQVIGKSMEPAVPDGSYCLFRAPVEGTRQGKTVLAQLRDTMDPETGERYTVKRYESEKDEQGDLWRHATITLRPMNPEFEPIILTEAEEGQLEVIAELIEVLRVES